MTTDVAWGRIQGVDKPSEWRTIKGRILYMMRLRGWGENCAELGRAAKIPTRQAANMMARFGHDHDVYVGTLRKVKEALNVNWDWLLENDGWPNDAVKALVTGTTRAKSTPPPPASHDDNHRTTPQHPPVHRLKRRPVPTK